MIILKNQFNGKSGEDIWSSLILSLPAEEVSKMAPRDQINSRGAGEGEEEEEEEVQPKSEPESETVEVEADEKDFEEEETPVELVRLEAAAPKGGKMSKTKTVKDLRQEYDKFARWVVQYSTVYPPKSTSVYHQYISNLSKMELILSAQVHSASRITSPLQHKAR